MLRQCSRPNTFELSCLTMRVCVEPGTNAEAVQPPRAHPNKFELLFRQLSSKVLGCALDGCTASALALTQCTCTWSTHCDQHVVINTLSNTMSNIEVDHMGVRSCGAFQTRC